jgi:predicted small secreted protein
MKKLVIGTMVVASLALSACGKNTESAVSEDQNTVVSDEQSPVTQKLALSASRSAVASYTVEAIDLETRRVNLRGEDGALTSTVIGEEAYNLDQVKVGDVVLVEHAEKLEVDVVSMENAKAGEIKAELIARAKKGETPGMAKMDVTAVSAIIEEINLEANTFKLKNASGEVKEYEARKPENLKKVAVGDLVIITLTQGFSIVVEK